MTDIAASAERIDEAARTATAVAQFEEGFSEADAYRIQAASIERRLSRGERRIGMKMGFTSRAKMVQMGVHDMIWGRLTDAMLVEEGGSLDLSRYVHPRVEPEIAFLIGKPLAGTVSLLEAQAAIAGIAPAMEIIDSRYENFKFSLGDVIADNASSSGLVVGPWNAPDSSIENLGMIMSFDGVPVQIGSSAAILGHPLRALVAAARLVAQGGESLSPGDIVLAGAATSAEALKPGVQVRLEVQRLGSIEFGVRK
ncbi:4-oxalocrotonate decarboxylase [Sphingobium sp. 22B]|uniref:2-keto-4-pentenoate hydratase n=1 Tax=unclassified Sphingobium TaxID=2611147 RepID=UPI000784BB1C|nr:MULTISPECIES: fumarylacetoacetate hydrolase family protein [unclassified Sphingobium]KXU29433.1 4-oxalocrotonate decarboxylase [Sphingobium sp. AM]KYC30860.1 4-oxalocrotonate decarboxylase [Sphingobium sp. 22B]OAP29393.1 4-oxalocrotonate decarboxylase [Sphingobium sp. 20006FA]